MAQVKSKKSKYISYSLRFGVAVVALYLAFRGQSWGEVFEVIFGMNFWIFITAFLFWFISQLFFVTRWTLLMSVQSIHIGFWPALRLHFLGIFYNNCLPTAVGGDFLRAWYVTTHTDKKLEAALTVFIDRAIGLLGMGILAFTCYTFIPLEGKQDKLDLSLKLNFPHLVTEYWWQVIASLILIVLIILGFWLTSVGRRLMGRGFAAIRHYGELIFQRSIKAAKLYSNRKLAVVLALFLTFCCQSVLIIGMWLVGREMGIGVSLRYYFVFFPISWVLGALPISVGGWGIWEGALIFMFGTVAVVSSEHILALALMHRILWLFGSQPGVIIHLIGAHLPKDFSVDYTENID